MLDAAAIALNWGGDGTNQVPREPRLRAVADVFSRAGAR
jgi:hypothetical protein